jgi:signal transduction histidine kinase
MSAIERQQLRDFSLAYRGAKGAIAIGKLVVLFCLMGIALHLSSPAKFGVVESLLLSNLFGISTAFGLVSVWFNYRRLPRPGLRSFLLIAGLATLGAAFGGGLVGVMHDKPLMDMMEKIGRSAVLAGFGAGVVYTIIHSIVAGWRNREYELLNTQLQLQTQQERLSREVTEAKLHLLQAQIEPHFLFNTLGAVQQLAQTECPQAADLTANLITFLRASLSEMRNDQVTLASEFRLVQAYLQVMKTRLGSRLEFTLELPANLEMVQVPGMLLLTLVENSIKHGIEPSLRGGSINVLVTLVDATVKIEVCDDGVGLSSAPTPGVGLANVRERLQLVYGGRASCTLTAVEPHGAIATLSFPFQLSGEST